jgi:hypothetical protein
MAEKCRNCGRTQCLQPSPLWTSISNSGLGAFGSSSPTSQFTPGLRAVSPKIGEMRQPGTLSRYRKSPSLRAEIKKCENAAYIVGFPLSMIVSEFAAGYHNAGSEFARISPCVMNRAVDRTIAWPPKTGPMLDTGQTPIWRLKRQFSVFRGTSTCSPQTRQIAILPCQPVHSVLAIQPGLGCTTPNCIARSRPRRPKLAS